MEDFCIETGGGDDQAYNPAYIFSGKPMKLLVLMQTTLLLQMQMLLKLVEHDLLPDRIIKQIQNRKHKLANRVWTIVRSRGTSHNKRRTE